MRSRSFPSRRSSTPAAASSRRRTCEPLAHHYRDRDGNEVDLLLERDGQLFPIEVKRSATVRSEWARVFSPLARLGMPIGGGAVVCLAPEAVPLGRDHVALPLGCI